MAEFPCDRCDLRADVAVRQAQSTPMAIAGREIGSVPIDALARCLFTQETGQLISRPDDCPYFRRALDAAIADGRL
jgi:hypothetical protein